MREQKKKIFSKTSIKLIVLQIAFLYLFSNAAARFYYSWNYEIAECLHLYGVKLGEQCFEKHPGYKIGELLAGPIHMMLYGLLIAAAMIGIVNRIRKKHILNTCIVLTVYVLLFLIGTFRFTNGLDSLLLKFAGIFTHKFWAMNFMIVQIYLTSGILILWLSVKNKYPSKNFPGKIQ